VGHESSTLPHIGDLIDGRYRIDRILGEGGTSTVYQVSHIITDKKFAIKWLLPELALDEAAVDRFIQEARVGGRFSHPYAVQVYDICKANDSFYMLMEFLEGESLQARLERVGRLSVAEACAIALICSEVLRAAHQAGIIHRDLKPANIFLCAASDLRGEIPKLLDFGISTFCAGLQPAGTTSVIGTPLYMAPEQMLGEPADPRTDIYALGAVLYELVSGRPPFHADSYADLVALVTGDAEPTPLTELVDVDPAFAAIVVKAMARAPSARFASTGEIAQALSCFAIEKGITPAPRPSEVASVQGEDTAAELRRALVPSGAARSKRFLMVALSLSAVAALVLASSDGESRTARLAREREALLGHPTPLVLDQDEHANTDEASGPTLARLELFAEPAALAEKRLNAPAAAARTGAPRAGSAPKLKLEAATTSGKSEPAHVRKLASRELLGTRLRADAAQALTPPASAVPSVTGRLAPPLRGATAPTHTSALPNVTHASPAPSTPAVRVKRSDFSGESPAATRVPAAAVSRQDF